MNANKQFQRGWLSSFLILALLSPVLIAKAQDDTPTVRATNNIAVDNSRQNREDRNMGAVTSDQQGNSPADLRITKQIRRTVERDNGLSVMAKNAKIITVNGVVTLRGPVKSLEEKSSIEQLAQKVAGEKNVNNQLEVKNNQNQ